MGKKEKLSPAISLAGMKVGDVRFFERNGKVYSRMSTTRSMNNERTARQMINRLRFSSVQLLWSAFKNELKGSFESVAPEKSSYTTFMKLNHNNGVFLNKMQQEKRFQIATPLHISDGSLPSLGQVLNADEQVVTDIPLGDFVFTDATTIRDFTSCVCGGDVRFSYGDELHFVALNQLGCDTDHPYCTVEVSHLTLDIQDERPLLAVTGKCPLSNKDGFLASKTQLGKGCFAFYLSRKVKQNILASPQMLLSNNDELIEKYISEEQFQEARQSFGKSEDNFICGWQFEKPTFD